MDYPWDYPWDYPIISWDDPPYPWDLTPSVNGRFVLIRAEKIMDHLEMGFIRLYPQFLATSYDPPEWLVVPKDPKASKKTLVQLKYDPCSGRRCALHVR